MTDEQKLQTAHVLEVLKQNLNVTLNQAESLSDDFPIEVVVDEIRSAIEEIDIKLGELNA